MSTELTHREYFKVNHEMLDIFVAFLESYAPNLDQSKTRHLITTYLNLDIKNSREDIKTHSTINMVIKSLCNKDLGELIDIFIGKSSEKIECKTLKLQREIEHLKEVIAELRESYWNLKMVTLRK